MRGAEFEERLSGAYRLGDHEVGIKTEETESDSVSVNMIYTLQPKTAKDVNIAQKALRDVVRFFSVEGGESFLPTTDYMDWLNEQTLESFKESLEKLRKERQGGTG